MIGRSVTLGRGSGQDLAAHLAVGCVALFWIGTFVAGALAPGYSVREDYISSLAGRGSEVAVLGVATLLVIALAHLAAAAAVRGAVGVPLALAGVAGLVVASFRIACPGGAAGCSLGGNGAVPDLADLTHGWAVVGYEVALVAAMAAVAAQLVRTRPVAAALTVGVAVLSAVIALRIGAVDGDRGWWERGWLVVNTGWLVLLVTTRRGRSAGQA